MIFVENFFNNNYEIAQHKGCVEEWMRRNVMDMYILIPHIVTNLICHITASSWYQHKICCLTGSQCSWSSTGSNKITKYYFSCIFTSRKYISWFCNILYHTTSSLLTVLWLGTHCRIKLRLSLLSNQDLKLICFYRFLLTILPTCSASASVAA